MSDRVGETRIIMNKGSSLYYYYHIPLAPEFYLHHHFDISLISPFLKIDREREGEVSIQEIVTNILRES